MIFVLQEVMHSESEIFQTEFAKVFARDRERVEIVLFEISPKLPSPFLVFSPEKTSREKEQRDNNRSDHIDAKLALEGFNHTRWNIGIFAYAPSGDDLRCSWVSGFQTR